MVSTYFFREIAVNHFCERSINLEGIFSGNGYQTTNYDRMTEDIGREMTTVPPIRERDNQNTNRDDVLYFSID